MARQVVIIHGWSDTSKSFAGLTAFLRANGFQPFPIWLGDYISLDDDVRIEDVAKRMQVVIQDAMATKGLLPPFDVIIHSTGGLVLREWIASYYPSGAGCPAKRVVMLAPANFGSKLAHTGKSFLGRIIKGWNNWFQTGEEMLLSLELASAYQWNLANRDLFGEGDSPYGPGKILPFVITGSRGYTTGVNQIANEPGADGTVRACAANLNAEGVTIDFAADPISPDIRGWRRRAGALSFPFALLPDRNHGSITNPVESVSALPAVQNRLGQLILEALDCADNAAAYGAIDGRWAQITDETGQLGEATQAAIRQVVTSNPPKPEDLRRYMQLNVFVRDDYGIPVDDYVLEFFSPNTNGSKDMVYFQTKVLKNVHNNTLSKVRRCFYVDHTELLTGYYKPPRTTLAMSISADDPGKNVHYFDSRKVGAEGHVDIHAKDTGERGQLGAERLRRNATHLVEIVIPRKPIDDVFKLKQAPP